MKLTTTLMASTAMVMAGTTAFADSHMSNEMTIVSWGGAYSASQKAAYHDPYSEMTGVTIVNDESSAEAVAKLRAMSEAGNVTWDVVDVVAADAIRLCDEGLALEIDPDTQLADGDDGSKASDDFGAEMAIGLRFLRLQYLEHTGILDFLQLQFPINEFAIENRPLFIGIDHR